MLNAQISIFGHAFLHAQPAVAQYPTVAYVTTGREAGNGDQVVCIGKVIT